MTAVIAGGMIFISIRGMTRIVDGKTMLSCFIDMAIKCPYCPVTQDAGD